MKNLFLIIAVVLVVLWGLGFYVFPSTNFIHVLLAIAVIVLIIHVVRSRRLI